MMYLLQDATFWTAVSFILFVCLVYWKARGLVSGVLHSRIERIRSQLKEAEVLRDDAKKILSDLSLDMESCERRSAELLASAQHEAEALLEQSKLRTDELLRRKVEGAKMRIRQEELAARQSIHDAVVDSSIAVTTEILLLQGKEISTPLFKRGLEGLKNAKLN